MNKKRIIGTIIVKNDYAVQSFGYKKYLPLGKPEILAKNLERWCVDEIAIIDIDRSKKKLGPNLNLLKKIKSINLNTPLIYGGGISTYKDALNIITNGADRIIIENLVHKDLNSIFEISNKIGSQSLIVSMPLAFKNKNLFQYNYSTNSTTKISDNFKTIINKKLISEILIIDYINEGYPDNFNEKLIKYFPIKNFPIISFGGISTNKKINKIIKFKSVTAIAVGNSLNYKENALKNIKNGSLKHKFRPIDYQL
mgnify:CR=1 FL=1